MASDFRELLRSISHQLGQQEIGVLVSCTHLPSELKQQSAEVVLDCLSEHGKFSARNLEVLMDAMKEIGRNDLYKEVKLFKKKSRKKLSEDISSSPESGVFLNFDIAESEATQLRNTLIMMEGSEAMDGVKRIEEVYGEARDTAENLLRIIRRANCLSRTLLPAAQRTAENRNRPPAPAGSPPHQTSSTECPDAGEPSPVSGGFMERLSKRMGKSTRGNKVAKGKQDEVPKSQRKLNRSQSEKGVGKLSKQNSKPPTPNTKAVDSDSDDSLDYDLPDFPLQRQERPSVAQTMPRQVPQRQQSSNSIHRNTPPSISPRETFALPHKTTAHTRGMMSRGPILQPHHEPSDSEDDIEYDDVATIFEMQNSHDRKSSMLHNKLQSEGTKFSRTDTSSTCSTPSSEVTTPPATLPKPTAKASGIPGTPAIPIRRSSLKSSSSTHVGSLQSSVSKSQPSGSDTTPNQPMVDIQQQLRETVRLKHGAISPQSTTSSSSRVSPHPVSLAKALEMSNNQSFSSDYNDSCSCTGDSGFDEYIPISTSWHKNAPPTRPKPKSLKPNGVEPLQSYANIAVLSPTGPRHTTISQLAPMYTTHPSTSPSPPTADHTTISAVAPMYNIIAIEEQEQEVEDVCPDYINVKQYVES